MSKKNLRRKLFGTDGVRGRANIYPMTVETALSLGRAMGALLKKKAGKHRVVIGKDTRLSCYMFENALISGLCSMGVDTCMVGPLPTPGVAFITRAYRADAGIVISASHNSFRDNGIKIFSSDGFKLDDEVEKEIESLVFSKDFSSYLPTDESIGKNSKIIDADGRYVEFIKATLPKKMTFQNLRVVLDCAHGAAYRVAPLVFQELDAQLHVFANQPNGLNINEGCGSMHPQQTQKAVLEQRADVGITLDGDADRVVLVDENAQIVDGDTILAICARDMKQKGILSNERVVGTVMSNLGLIKAMQAEGIDFIQSQVGDRYVIQDMLKHECNLGGEQSGHMIFLDHNSTGDGLVSALQVLRIMIETDSKLSDLASFVKKYPQANINVPVDKKPPLEDLPRLCKKMKEVEKELGDTGRILVRYSGTENICRVMIEGKKQKQVSQMAQDIAKSVKEEIGV